MMEKETKATGEGYSKERSNRHGQLDMRGLSYVTGNSAIQTSQALQPTTKLTHLGSPIDIVKTNSGHYVSRKMIEQLRQQGTAVPHQSQAIGLQGTNTFANSQKRHSIAAAVSKVYDMDGPMIVSKTDNHTKYFNEQPQKDYAKKYSQLQTGHQAKDSGKQAPTNNDRKDTSMAAQRNNYDHDGYGQNKGYSEGELEEYPSSNNHKPQPPGKKKPRKEKNDKKMNQQQYDDADNQDYYDDQSMSDQQKSQYYQDTKPYLDDQPSEFYGPYGAEKNYQAMFRQQAEQLSSKQSAVDRKHANKTASTVKHLAANNSHHEQPVDHYGTSQPKHKLSSKAVKSKRVDTNAAYRHQPDYNNVAKNDFSKKADAAGGDTNFLGELSLAVKGIKKYEDSCKVLDELYVKSGLNLSSQINYDYVAFSKNCLNIVTSLLNEVSLKDRTKDLSTRAKIDKLKKSIADRQGHVDFLMSLEDKQEVYSKPALRRLTVNNKNTDNIQISSLLPSNMNNFVPVLKSSDTQYKITPQVPTFTPAQITQMASMQNMPGMQTEIIKNYLTNGSYGSYITNPFTSNSTPQSTIVYSMLPQTSQVDQSATGAMALPDQPLVNYYGSDDIDDTNNIHTHTGIQQANFDENIAMHAISNNDAYDQYEVIEQAVNDAKLNFIPGLSYDPELYSGATGLFGSLTKKAVAYNQARDVADDDINDNFKNVFSLFTGKQQATVGKQQSSIQADDSCSNEDLKLYSDENEDDPLDMHESLEKILDDSLSDINESSSVADIQAGQTMPINDDFLEQASSHHSTDHHVPHTIAYQSNVDNQPMKAGTDGMSAKVSVEQIDSIQNRSEAADRMTTPALVQGRTVQSSANDRRQSVMNRGSTDNQIDRSPVSRQAKIAKGESTDQTFKKVSDSTVQESQHIESSRVGQNLELQSVKDRDLAVPTMTTPSSYQQSEIYIRKQQTAVDRRGDNKSLIDKQDTRKSGGNPDASTGSNHIQKEKPLKSMLNLQQTQHLMDLGRKAYKAISAIANISLDTYADSRPRKNDKKTENNFFSRTENPDNLTIYELCITSEYSGIVQRKLTRLKEPERIDLFYLMRPNLLRLTLDGLGKYVIHGLISMSRINLPRRENNHTRIAFVLRR